MRTAGIIAEYNPFHTGHEYHIRKAKELTGADFAIIVMSPDFVQRGEPAIFDKYTRAEMALRCGADLVVELPVCYAAGSAEYFAEGSVRLLEKLGVTDALCFGAEMTPEGEIAATGHGDETAKLSEVSSEGTSTLFRKTAQLLLEEPDAYREALQSGLRRGLTFPQARTEAIRAYLKEPRRCTDLLSSPNNLLGVEYCKALQKIHSKIRPVPLARRGSRYSSDTLGGEFCSAGAIRSAIQKESPDARIWNTASCESPVSEPEDSLRRTLSPYIPESCSELFWKSCKAPVFADSLLPILYQKLIMGDRFDEILDISPDLSDRICGLRDSCIGKSFEEIAALLKTRQITQARIRRALLHLVLDIRKDTVEAYRPGGSVFYAHVLGFRSDAAPLLHEIKKRSSLPFLTKASHAPKLLSGAGLRMWKQDVAASHLYRSLQTSRYGLTFRNEYKISPKIISS
ncbi:MAG: nucleotidyltransferase family protein [Lachnospiraceae bacterium]|nr:nucleotidyltransferase family protein [Lachnospiraceae bacterium]